MSLKFGTFLHCYIVKNHAKKSGLNLIYAHKKLLKPSAQSNHPCKILRAKHAPN